MEKIIVTLWITFGIYLMVLLAIQRQRDTKPIEFQQYFDYCEQCKIAAKG